MAKTEKRKTRSRVLVIWKELQDWCSLPETSDTTVEQCSLSKAIRDGWSFDKVVKHEFPWGEGVAAHWQEEGQAGKRHVIGSLHRSYLEKLRCEEELRLIDTEIARAVVYYGKRVVLLQSQLMACAGVLSSEHVLLSFHHRHNQHMLTAFTVLQSGAVPKDRSYIGNYTQDS